ncbi:MAG: ribonuclease HIII [Melioribacteraceae bacterium]|nr:ribonuclease HIII [Melioribacteraceae bacterium]
MNVKESAKQTLSNYAKQISDFGFTVSNMEMKQYNYEITIENPPNKLKLQSYFGKKGVKTIIQGNKETALYNSIYSLVFGEELFENKESDLTEPDNYIGSDESGKGDFFGPLVVAAVHVEKKLIPELKKIGVKDSKLISDQQISVIAGKMYRNSKINFAVLKIVPEKYNLLYSKFLNLNKMMDWAHSKVITDLLESSNSKKVITDKFSKAGLSVQNNFPDVSFTQISKGERYTAVAAASIIARDHFNQWFIDQENSGISLLKGASALVEEKGREVVNYFGTSELDKLCKKHFKTYNKVLDN